MRLTRVLAADVLQSAVPTSLGHAWCRTCGRRPSGRHVQQLQMEARVVRTAPTRRAAAGMVSVEVSNPQSKQQHEIEAACSVAGSSADVPMNIGLLLRSSPMERP